MSMLYSDENKRHQTVSVKEEIKLYALLKE